MRRVGLPWGALKILFTQAARRSVIVLNTQLLDLNATRQQHLAL